MYAEQNMKFIDKTPEVEAEEANMTFNSLNTSRSRCKQVLYYNE